MIFGVALMFISIPGKLKNMPESTTFGMLAQPYIN